MDKKIIIFKANYNVKLNEHVYKNRIVINAHIS